MREQGIGEGRRVWLTNSRPVQGTAQIAVEISFKGFWAVSLALKVVSSHLRRSQGSRRSRGYEKAVWHFFRRVLD